jgi:16S rRNA (cytidine1402-2'-O)-methyltransferase
MKPALLLLPNLLGEHRHHELFLPASVDRAVESIHGLIAESEKAGRRYLSRFQTEKRPHDIPLALCNKNTLDDEIDFLLEPMTKGECWGLISDCGLPCLADPGARLVKRARQLGISVKAFVGPSSIVLALMLSGLSGQTFSFHGYLDKKSEAMKKQLQQLERQPGTHIFMERPYQNRQTLETLLETLDDSIQLCVAWELTMPEQGVMTQSVATWKKSPLPNLDKKNALFLFQI